jgi:AraC-like DNA-binding protein
METRTRRDATTSTDIARVLLRYATTVGLDSEAILRGVDLGRSVVEDAEARIPVEQFNAIWQEIARRAQDQNLGLHVGEAAPYLLRGHVLLSVMMNCPTVQSAIEKVDRYHGLLADFVRLRLTQQKSYAYLTWEPVHADIALDRHHSESISVMLVSVLRRLTEHGIDLVEVRFNHPRPDDTREHRQVLGCPVVFDWPEDQLVFGRQVLSLPIFLANPELLEMLEEYAQRMLERLHTPDTWTGRVTQSLGSMMIQGEKPSLDAVAFDLALSTRSLQNQLKAEETTYRQLLDQVRKEIALDYLERPEVTMCDIAFLLGFSEQSAFTHAFKRWTGSSPTEYLNA